MDFRLRLIAALKIIQTQALSLNLVAATFFFFSLLNLDKGLIQDAWTMK